MNNDNGGSIFIYLPSFVSDRYHPSAVILITVSFATVTCHSIDTAHQWLIDPNVTKTGALQRQGAKVEAVAIYCDPLATQALECSGFPERVENMRKLLFFLEFTDGEIQNMRKLKFLLIIPNSNNNFLMFSMQQGGNWVGKHAQGPL